MNTKLDRPLWRRPALVFGAAVLALSLTVAAMPPARAWARNVLAQIGVITLVEEAAPVVVEPNTGPVPTSTPIPADRPAKLTTVEQVAAEAGFTPLVPAVLPEGYALTDLGAMEYVDTAWRSEGLGTFLRYTPGQGDAFVEVQQSRFYDETPRELAIGDVPVVEVTVRGEPGAWLAGLPTDSDRKTYDMLLWWEDGYVFSVQTNALTLDEVLAIAESLAP